VDQHDQSNQGKKNNTGPISTGRLSGEKSKDRLAEFSGTVLDRVDSVIYAIVGVCFLIASIFALCYSSWEFSERVKAMFVRSAYASAASSVIQFVSELLLVLIILEVMGTIVHYLKSHTTSLQPFLFIGIVSATRSLLSIGARLSVEQVKGDEFTHAIIELGVNAAVILALGVTLKLLGKFVEDHPDNM
jgi:uncharacterized membrane protein (DUF373 family)